MYVSDLRPPTAEGGTTSISSSRPFLYIIQRIRAPLLLTGTSNKVGLVATKGTWVVAAAVSAAAVVLKERRCRRVILAVVLGSLNNGHAYE